MINHSTIQSSAVVIGGGVAGMQTGIELANRGVKTYLVERLNTLGGRGYLLSRTFRTQECKTDGCCMDYCRECIYTPKYEELEGSSNLEVLVNTEIMGISGGPGKYKVNVKNGSGERVIDANAVVLATGSKTFDPARLPELGHEYKDVITFLELEGLTLQQREDTGAPIENFQFKRPSDGKVPQTINILLCVGSRDENKANKHCSIVCCTYAIGQAKELKRQMPDAEIMIHNMDLRGAYRGFEEFYKEAQEMGVQFIRGRVAEVTRDPKADQLYIRYENVELGEVFEQPTDLVILAVGQEPHDGTSGLAEMLNLPLNESGFIDDVLPLDFTEKTGIAVAGAALGPKGIRYSVKDGLRAAAEVMRFLNNGSAGGGDQ
jgi:heterodisulfide reductase subunit A